MDWTNGHAKLLREDVPWRRLRTFCGFGMSVVTTGSGARKMIMACSEVLGWFPISEKCGPVWGQNSLDAELEGCGMLTDTWCQWIDRCVRSQRTLHQDYCACVSPLQCIFRWHVLHARGPLPSPPVRHLFSGWRRLGVRGCVVSGICGTRVMSLVDIDRDQQARAGVSVSGSVGTSRSVSASDGGITGQSST